MAQFDAAFKGDSTGLRTWCSENTAGIDGLSADRQMSALYTASRFGQFECVKVLVEAGADINRKNGKDKSTPLHGACFGGHAAIVKYLVERGAKVDAKNAYKETPTQNAGAPAEGVTSAQQAECKANLSAPLLPPPPPPAPPADPTPAAEPAPAAAPAPAPPSAALKAFTDLTLAKLRGLCKDNGLDGSGTKAQLAERLVAKFPEGPPAKESKKTKADAPADASDAPPESKPKTEEPAAEESTVDPTLVAKLSSATFTKDEVAKDTEAFWDLEEKVMAWNQGRNDDYVKNRLKKKLKPLTFILKRAWKVNNPVLEEAFAAKRKALVATRGDSVSRIRVAFHGTREENIDSILKTSLLRFKHPLNPCKTQADDGYFGTNRKGVYVSRYFDYTLKYANQLRPINESDCVKIIMFKCLPGSSKHIEALNIGMEPTDGFDSHSSPSHLEWYLFDESQLCPDYIVEIQAKEDTRTAADDE